MIDNQDNSNTPDNESVNASQSDVSNQPIAAVSSNNELDYSKLTHQNWLYINAFLSCGSVTKAYQLAKYEGKDPSSPYQTFKRLKPYIEQIGDLDVTSRARLQANVKAMLDLPLDPEKKYLTFSEMLRLNKFVAALTPEATNQKPNISVLVINRGHSNKQYSDDTKANGQIDTNRPPDQHSKDVVIDAQIVKP